MPRGGAGSRLEKGKTIADKTASWTYAERYVVEGEAMDRARSRAQTLGMPVVGSASGALLRAMAAMLDARGVVEVGTGVGVSGLWLLEGMAPGGVLTTIDVDRDHQRAARGAFAEVGTPPARIRCITGRARDVLSRLTEGGYDMVLLDADPAGVEDYLDSAVSLLCPGGVLALAGATADDRVGDPARRDAATVAVRDTLRSVSEHPSLVPALVPASDGLLLGVRRRR